MAAGGSNSQTYSHPIDMNKSTKRYNPEGEHRQLQHLVNLKSDMKSFHCTDIWLFNLM
jgi:hypothetical protein